MIRTKLTIGDEHPQEQEHTDTSVEEAAHRLRQLLHESFRLTVSDAVPRQITVFVGRVPNSTATSSPRRPSPATTSLGVDAVSLSGIVELALRSLYHPAIKSVDFTTEAEGQTLLVTDVNDKKFQISIYEKGT
jgi:hypothetical protein